MLSASSVFSQLSLDFQRVKPDVELLWLHSSIGDTVHPRYHIVGNAIMLSLFHRNHNADMDIYGGVGCRLLGTTVLAPKSMAGKLTQMT